MYSLVNALFSSSQFCQCELWCLLCYKLNPRSTKSGFVSPMRGSLSIVCSSFGWLGSLSRGDGQTFLNLIDLTICHRPRLRQVPVCLMHVLFFHWRNMRRCFTIFFNAHEGNISLWRDCLNDGKSLLVWRHLTLWMSFGKTWWGLEGACSLCHFLYAGLLCLGY